jgi:diguanylate cyclase (GGDEF)-like protein
VDGVDVNALPAGLVLLDADDRVVSANASFVEWAGLGSDVIGRPLGEIMTRAPDDLIDDVSGSGPSMMVHSSDPERAALVHRGAHGDGALLTVLDASERYRALRGLRASYALADRTRTRLELIIRASIAFSSATSEDDLAGILADTAAQAYRAEESVVFLLGEDRSFRLAAGVNPFADVFDPVAAAATALTLREVITVTGADGVEQDAPDLARAMRHSGVQAIIAAPLRHERHAYGVFACFFRHSRQFDQEAGPLADALAGQAAQALAGLRLQHRLEHAAMHDETTGLPNRRLLEDQILTRGTSEGTLRAVLFLDVDGFKAVNDRFGHQVGDDILREAATRLQRTVRDDDMVARFGGDEFVVVCEVADLHDAEEIAERLRDSFAVPFSSSPEPLTLSVSVGLSITQTPDAPLSPDHLIRAADHAMYRAKRQGGNRVIPATWADLAETGT